MSDSKNDNPFLNSEADKPMDIVTREDCYWGTKQENTLYDAYIMLRDAGYTEKELEPLGEMLNRTTIYNQENAELFYKEYVK